MTGTLPLRTPEEQNHYRHGATKPQLRSTCRSTIVVRKMSRFVAAFSLTLLAGCASSQARDEVMPPDPMSLQACPPGGEDVFCYPAPLKAAPVVTGPGRVRVLLPDWEPPQRFADPARFLISEASDSGFKTVARGTCPEGSRAESLGQIASGRSTVLCRG